MKALLLLLLPLAACAGPVYNAAVTQDTIETTICVSGWTAKVRPSTVYTDWVKEQKLRDAGLPLSDATNYELDHVMPLALGGHPHAIRNLELQLWPEAKQKDKVEAWLQRQVCAHKMTLAAARSCIQHWRTCR